MNFRRFLWFMKAIKRFCCLWYTGFHFDFCFKGSKSAIRTFDAMLIDLSAKPEYTSISISIHRWLLALLEVRVIISINAISFSGTCNYKILDYFIPTVFISFKLNNFLTWRFFGHIILSVIYGKQFMEFPLTDI